MRQHDRRKTKRHYSVSVNLPNTLWIRFEW